MTKNMPHIPSRQCNYMKKLLIITDLYPDAQRPVAGIFVQHQAEALAQYYEVKVLASFFPEARSYSITRENNIEIHRICFPQSIYAYPLTSFEYRRAIVPVLNRILGQWKPDIIHVHDCRHIPELHVLVGLLRHSSARKILSLHNVKTLPEYAEHSYLKWYYRLTLRSALSGWKHIFCVSNRLVERLGSFVPAGTISNLGNAILPEMPSSDPFIGQLAETLLENAFHILAVANLKKSKGLDLLIRAVHDLVRDGHFIHVVIVGSGDDLPRLQRKAIELNIADSIAFYPEKPNDVIRNVYKLFDAFVLPSYSETFGIVYLEAMYAGIPVIGVSGQGIHGIAEDGITALFCKPRSAADLRHKLEYLIKNPAAAKQLGARGKDLVLKNYLMDGLISRLREAYDG